MDNLTVLVGLAPDDLDVVAVLRAVELLLVLIPFGKMLGDVRFELFMQLTQREHDAYRAAFGVGPVETDTDEDFERRHRPEHALRAFCLCLVPQRLRLGQGHPVCADYSHALALEVTPHRP